MTAPLFYQRADIFADPVICPVVSKYK